MGVATGSGQRIRWMDLPPAVRDGVESILGSAVVDAVSQPGGFSPGTADRVRTASGGRAFVKAICPARSARSTALHRQEARVTAALPAGVPAPRLLGCYDDGDWVALVLQDIPGRNPATPWRADELAVALATLDELVRTLTPAPLRDLPAASEALAEDFAGWRRIAEDPPAELHPWVTQRLDQLCRLEQHALAAVDGDTLVHRDIRADNLLLRPDGGATVVDWPRACRGAAWLDLLVLLLNVRTFGGHDTHALLKRRAAAAGYDRDDLVATIAGFAGYYLDAARRPPPPNVPGLRAFQRARARAALSWLREALDG